ncbi:hypothetical protein [Ornithinimicrobium kibberense]|uniref:hypothetical protein n=1 Tax=Ornithinimicrobium kibberense TaxID=282060 RepID=UPI00360954FF
MCPSAPDPPRGATATPRSSKGRPRDRAVPPPVRPRRGLRRGDRVLGLAGAPRPGLRGDGRCRPGRPGRAGRRRGGRRGSPGGGRPPALDAGAAAGRGHRAGPAPGGAGPRGRGGSVRGQGGPRGRPRPRGRDPRGGRAAPCDP